MASRTWNLTYGQRLETAILTTLELRRWYADLIMCYKIVFGLITLTFAHLFTFSPVTASRRHKAFFSRSLLLAGGTVCLWLLMVLYCECIVHRFGFTLISILFRARALLCLSVPFNISDHVILCCIAIRFMLGLANKIYNNNNNNNQSVCIPGSFLFIIVAIPQNPTKAMWFIPARPLTRCGCTGSETFTMETR